MAFAKGIINFFSLSDEDEDDDYDEYDDIDEEEDEEDEEPSRWELRKAQKAAEKTARKEEKERSRREREELNAQRQQERDAERSRRASEAKNYHEAENLDHLEKEKQERENRAKTVSAPRSTAASRSGQRIKPVGKGSALPEMDICVVRPVDIVDERNIADTLNEGRTVLLVVEGIDIQLAQRILDFTSGSAYALGGNMQKISSYIFLATPHGVDITGDINSSLLQNYDASSYTV